LQPASQPSFNAPQSDRAQTDHLVLSDDQPVIVSYDEATGKHHLVDRATK
jgi:hypothetical protein